MQALQHTRFASGVVGRSRAGAFFACSSRQNSSRVCSIGRLDQWDVSLDNPNPASIHVPLLTPPRGYRYMAIVDLAIPGYSPAAPRRLESSGGAQHTPLLLCVLTDHCGRRWLGQQLGWKNGKSVSKHVASAPAMTRSSGETSTRMDRR